MSNIQIISIIFFSCLVTAFSRITLKKGLIVSNAITGMVFSLIFGWAILLILFLIDLKNQLYSIDGILFFAGIGIIAPPVVRYLTYIGIDKLGPSRSDPIRSLTPMFAVLFSFIFFNEEFNYFSLLATAVIIYGSYLLSSDQNFAQKNNIHLYFFLFPFIAAVLAGFISNLRKLGMSYEISPIAAALSSATSAIFIFSLFLIYKKNYRRLKVNKDSISYLIITGVLVSITDIIDLIALKHSKVSFAAPLLAATPLFVIFLSSIFLKTIEQITKKVVFGSILIFIGVITITIFGKAV